MSLIASQVGWCRMENGPKAENWEKWPKKRRKSPTNGIRGDISMVGPFFPSFWPWATFYVSVILSPFLAFVDVGVKHYIINAGKDGPKKVLNEFIPGSCQNDSSKLSCSTSIRRQRMIGTIYSFHRAYPAIDTVDKILKLIPGTKFPGAALLLVSTLALFYLGPALARMSCKSDRLFQRSHLQSQEEMVFLELSLGDGDELKRFQ